MLLFIRVLYPPYWLNLFTIPNIKISILAFHFKLFLHYISVFSATAQSCGPTPYVEHAGVILQTYSTNRFNLTCEIGHRYPDGTIHAEMICKDHRWQWTRELISWKCLGNPQWFLCLKCDWSTDLIEMSSTT